ncbi:MAG: AtpZ/AtpI family protein [bacterium]
MNEKPEIEIEKKQSDFSQKISETTARKIKAKSTHTPGVWFGLSMMGIIGWSVVVPTLLGTALGIWLDKHYPGTHSWTPVLLAAGLILGCWNAWRWMNKETKDNQEKDDE